MASATFFKRNMPVLAFSSMLALVSYAGNYVWSDGVTATEDGRISFQYDGESISRITAAVPVGEIAVLEGAELSFCVCGFRSLSSLQGWDS